MRAPSSFRPFAHLAAAALLLAGLAAPIELRAQDAADSEPFAEMRWRNIGPSRGGRSVAATGVVGDPMTYYFGGTGGGVFKTEDAGATWANVSDGYFGTGSVGAIAVAESDPNVVYVGMGEHAVRGVMTSHGDGVYRSTDAGRTWQHLGLEDTRVISRIRVHPEDPDLVYVAAQGAVHGYTEDRGIYRSRDGGATWDKIHYVSDRAGASDLAMDMNNPRILYASYWEHIRRPWVVESGGEGSGIWKSTDGGDTWTELTAGLPETMGKIGVDVSRADSDRVYAIVEADPGTGGLFRSDDGGSTWRLMSSDRSIQTRSWYYMEVYADTQDVDVVYVMNAPFMKSIDGGRTFANVQVPHGDNHDLWINPDDNRNLINANDGGANVSFNGGASWSTQQNQTTAQFYRVITDNQFPYRVYGGQQDNTSVSIVSAAPGGIGWQDWHPVAGCESAYLAFDPDDPEWVYGGCYQGIIDVLNVDTGEGKAIMQYPELRLSVDPREHRYRFNWNAPIVASPQDPSVIYHAGNVVFRTSDRGQTWERISDDLTRDDDEKQGPGGGPITSEGAGGEVYGTIMYLAASPHDAGTLWAGSDDGLVHLTRDGGANWTNVTPPDLGEGLVNSIEVSPHDPAKAFVVVTYYKFNDLTPHVYRTTDYGASWQLVRDGIDDEAWVRVVREDPVRPGLLYAGTELGMYLSTDDGDSWREWQLNLPVVPVTDLTIRDNDLVAATQGRAFWILDDLSPVQQLDDDAMGDEFLLLAPRTTKIVQWGGFFGGLGAGSGQNPPSGAQLFFWAAAESGDPAVLEIVAPSGEVVRTFSADPEATGHPDADELSVAAGLNRVAWNFRYPDLAETTGLTYFGSTAGRMVPPGSYTVRLTVGEQVQEQPLMLEAVPWRTATAADYAEQDAFLVEAQSLAEDVHRSAARLWSARAQLGDLIDRIDGRDGADAVVEAAREVVAAIDEWDGEIMQRQTANFQDIINFENRFAAEVIAVITAVDGGEPPVTAGARERLADLLTAWAVHAESRDAIEASLAELNQSVVAAGFGGVILPEDD